MSAAPEATQRQLEAARNRGALRRLGYRWLPGDTFSYLLHLRPLEWPIMVGHTTLGFLLAGGMGPLSRGERSGTLLGALFVWVVCLNGGTLALNSAYDQDEGDIGYLDAPPPPPRGLARFSLRLMFLGLVLAFMLPTGFTIAYGVCFLMSIAYSVPPFRLKAVAGADWVINMVGFGTLTPYAGWAATGRPLTTAALWVLLGFMPLFAALYPPTQLYQIDEDRARGDRTLAIAIGIRNSLAVAVAMTIVAFAMFGWAGNTAGLSGRALSVLGLAFAAWLIVLLPWMAAEPTRSNLDRKRGMYRALAAWAVTDLAILIAFS